MMVVVVGVVGGRNCRCRFICLHILNIRRLRLNSNQSQFYLILWLLVVGLMMIMVVEGGGRIADVCVFGHTFKKIRRLRHNLKQSARRTDGYSGSPSCTTFVWSLIISVMMWGVAQKGRKGWLLATGGVAQWRLTADLPCQSIPGDCTRHSARGTGLYRASLFYFHRASVAMATRRAFILLLQIKIPLPRPLAFCTSASFELYLAKFSLRFTVLALVFSLRIQMYFLKVPNLLLKIQCIICS